MPSHGANDLGRVFEQYHRLVNKKHDEGITSEEGTELARLDGLLDGADEAFYKDIIETLRTVIRKLSTPLSLEDVVAITRDWKVMNARRSGLIEKKINRTITADEEAELLHLQELAGVKRQLVSPLPIQDLEVIEADLRRRGLWKGD